MDNLTINKNQVIRIVVLSILLMAVYLIPYNLLFDKTNTVCLHKHLLGFQCPLCGMTRAVYHLMYLQITSALRYNFAAALLPFYMVCDVAEVFYPQKGFKLARKMVAILILASLLSLYAFRIWQHIWGI